MADTNIRKDKLIKGLILFNLISIAVALILGLMAFLLFYDMLLPLVRMMFSDFAEIMRFSLSSAPYVGSGSSSYPPLAILILYFPFALISRDVVHLGYMEIIKTPQFWTSFVLFYAIFFTAAALLLRKLIGQKGKRFAFFFLMVLSSGMILYTVVRGNIVLAALVFLLFFLAYHDSKNKILRELALISLAVSGALKIYPLLFGVLLLRDRRFFSAARAALYAVVLFFVPFLFFEDGFSNIKLFVANLGEFSLSYDRLLNIINMSAAGLVYKIFYVIGLPFGTPLYEVSKVLSIVLTALVAVAGVSGSLFSKSKLSLYVICTSAMMLIPSVSYYYTAVFIIVPMTEFLRDYENISVERRRFYKIFFAAHICSVSFLCSSLLGPLLIIALFYETVNNIKKYSREKRNLIFQGGSL